MERPGYFVLGIELPFQSKVRSPLFEAQLNTVQ
jgi:hypothetical protein